MRVLITGSGGFVGSAVAAEWEGTEHEVVRLVRRPGPLDDREWYWDPARGEFDPRLAGGVEAVVHLAGENIAGGRWTASRKARIRDSRVEGTRLLVDALTRGGHPPKTFVAASATGFYGDRGDETVDEESGPGCGFLAEVSMAWERAAEGLVQAGTRVVWLRMGMVLGPGGGALQKMLPIFRLGLGGVLGSGKQYWSWIDRRDLVRIVTRALTDDALRGALNAVAPTPVTNREFTHSLAAVVRRPAMVPVPRLGLRLLLGEMAQAVLLGSCRVVPRRLEALGHAFGFSELQRALADAVRVD